MLLRPPAVPRTPAFPFTDHDLDRFREVQQLAYHCAEQVAAWIEPGVTERQATAELRRCLVAMRRAGLLPRPLRLVRRPHRLPALPHPAAVLHAATMRLEDGMPYVLDCAPIVDGYTADIGYGGKVGENPVWDRLAADLRVYRELILTEVRARRPLDEVYAAVDAQIAAHGYDNRHRVYPGRVIGHQVTRTTSRGPAGVNVLGFGVRTLQTLGRELIGERLQGRSPLWADGRSSRHAPTPGLWAVEPHIGFRAVGIKFEELLVVTEDDAYWLDDDLPHVRRWTAAHAEATAQEATR